MDALVDAPFAHAAPVEQPASVHEIAARLFPAYSVDGGTVHLAGCRLEDRWFLRAETYHAGQHQTRFLDAGGHAVSPDEATRLGLWQTAPLGRPPRRVDEPLEKRLDQAAAAVREQIGDAGAGLKLSMTVIWCKWVEGKLRFTIGDESVDLPFQGWTRLLQAPAYTCPITGTKTYHLAATDDGQIVAARRVTACAESGQRAVDENLVTCTATGLKVLPERTERCPVSGETVLSDELVACRSCHQRVSPNVVRRRCCQACRQLHPIGKADPRMARVLDEHPALDRFHHWRITETAEVYVLACRRWMKRLVLVVDKATLELREVSTGMVGSSRLKRLEPAQYPFELND
jgi:hypothetical protein